MTKNNNVEQRFFNCGRMVVVRKINKYIFLLMFKMHPTLFLIIIIYNGHYVISITENKLQLSTRA